MKFKIYLSEAVGTFLLCLLGCGAIAFKYDILTTACAFGLVYFVLFYSFGNISGCHFNPVVSISMLIQKRIKIADFFLYILSQLIGAFIGCMFLKLILTNDSNNFAAISTSKCCNGDYIAAMFVEIILSYLFVLTFLGANSKSRNKNVRGIIIGSGMILVCIIGSITNFTAVNPMRVLFAGIFCNYYKGIFVFLVAPFLGSILATYHFLYNSKKEEEYAE